MEPNPLGKELFKVSSAEPIVLVILKSTCFLTARTYLATYKREVRKARGRQILLSFGAIS
jgi:hypothetical protein